MNQYEFLEILNGIWSMLDLCLLAWFSYYIYVQVKVLEGFIWRHSLKFWSKHGVPAHINAAIAIYVFTTGDFIVRTHIWLWRHYQNIDHHAHEIALWPLILGGIIAAVGLLCKIRVFTVYKFGNKAWIASAIFTLLLVLIAMMTHINF